jgi:uncharacterized membrane protein
MLTNAWIVTAVLASTVALLLRARRSARFALLFRWVPVPFYAYFAPALLSAIGLVPRQHAVYDAAGAFLLPPCLALLVLNADPGALRKLGRPAVGALALGFAGVMAGMVAAHGILARWLPDGAWAGAGALAASWTGGSANMIAVKEALAAPESAFAPVIVIDAFFAYAWMAFLIWAAGRQARFDAWVGARGDVLVPGDDRVAGRRAPWPWVGVPVAALAVGALGILVGRRLGPALSSALAALSPSVAAGFKPTTWTVLAVTTAALLLALTGRFRARPERTEFVGNALLYFLLTTLGAQASLEALGRAPAYLVLGAGALAAHALFLIVGAKMFRLPLALVATASQACVGGVVSAPMVAAVYRPTLAAVGLLLAVAGNVVGTYLGLLTAQICLFWGGRS